MLAHAMLLEVQHAELLTFNYYAVTSTVTTLFRCSISVLHFQSHFLHSF